MAGHLGRAGHSRSCSASTHAPDERGAVLRAPRASPQNILLSHDGRALIADFGVARMLRNLKAIHAASNDVVGLIGATERLRLVGAARPAASSAGEQLECAAVLASALIALRWEARRGEARALLEGVLADDEGPKLAPKLAPEGRRQIESLLADEWLQSAAS